MKILFRENYLSKDNSNCLKAIFALMIVLSHLYSNRSFFAVLGPIFTSFGYLSVAGFLFFSGYGLTYSYAKKGQEYFNGYFKKRILPIYIINSLLIAAYTLFKCLIKYELSVKEVLLSFVFGDTVVQFGWYIQMIMLFYVLYFLSFNKSFIKNGLIKLTFALIVYCAFCVIIKKGSTWYESSFAFLLGAVWANLKPWIDKELKSTSKYLVSLFLNAFIFGGTFIFGNSKIFPDILRIPMKMISAVVFVALIINIVMRVRIDYQPVRFAGNYYFEVYFMQGFFIILFNNVFRINNTALLYSICILCVYISAIAVKPAVRWINEKCRGV